MKPRWSHHRPLCMAALAAVLASAPVLAAPGDSLGGDESTACAPNTKLGLLCAKKVLNALAKLRVAVVKCHLTQAGLTFQTGHGTNGSSNAEDNCEVGPSNTSAKAKFDARMTTLAGNGCDATVIANANTLETTILGDQTVTGSLDALNGSFFCDPTSGNPIDPGGDDAGTIPATPGNFKCSVVVAKSWAKLDAALYKCHAAQAVAVFKGVVPAIDEESCEDTGLKSALTKYDTTVNKVIALCPSCLGDPLSPTYAHTLATDHIADADANLQQIYVCPGP
jgi:hypothetical protein